MIIHGDLDLFLGLACRFLFAQLSAATLFAWLLIVLASAQLFVHSSAFDQFLETPKRHSNRFPVMNPHS
jgi:hypothetical protein